MYLIYFSCLYSGGRTQNGSWGLDPVRKDVWGGGARRIASAPEEIKSSNNGVCITTSQIRAGKRGGGGGEGGNYYNTNYDKVGCTPISVQMPKLWGATEGNKKGNGCPHLQWTHKGGTVLLFVSIFDVQSGFSTTPWEGWAQVNFRTRSTPVQTVSGRLFIFNFCT